MTIAISLKVNDGLVLASDSATSISATDNQGNSGIVNVYDNANKVFNLHKDIPVGAITWGRGSIGFSSTSTLVKDFRESITNDASHKIDPESYTIKDIADKFHEFIYTDKYQKEFAELPDQQKPALGFIIGGYSTDKTMAEEWRIDINNGKCRGPVLLRKQYDCGINWNGMPEAISRIVMGYSPALPQALLDSGIDSETVGKVMRVASTNLQSPMIIPAMPIQDVIDIAYFLIDLTRKYVKYNPGPPTVGGPIEIAAITKHEGFKWIKRKHYFDTTYNPGR